MTKDAVILVSSPMPGVTTIALNRPEKRNALDDRMVKELIIILKKIETDEKTRVVIFLGQGDHFCAGADLGWMQKMAESSEKENTADALQLATLLQLIHTFSKPTIALVQGATLGGGLGLIACCDIVLAASSASFCFSEVKIGLTPSVISPYIISAIGERAARYYFLTAEKFTAERAQQLGLIHHIVAPEKLITSGIMMTEVLLKNSSPALSEVKKLIQTVAGEKISDKVIKFTAEHLAQMRASDDAKEGLKAFLEKRIAK